jgi:hypothetical protein
MSGKLITWEAAVQQLKSQPEQQEQLVNGNVIVSTVGINSMIMHNIERCCHRW